MSDWLDHEVPIEWLLEMLDVIRQTPDLDWLLLSKRLGMWQYRLNDAFDRRVEILPGTEFEDDPLVDFIHNWLKGNAPDNIWIGTTMENQKQVELRTPLLVMIPAKIHFVSCEPLLSGLNLDWVTAPDDQVTIYPLAGTVICEGMNEPVPLDHGGIDWVICGGESGPRSRPIHPDWARNLRDQCAQREVPFFFKQWGEYRPAQHGETDGQERHIYVDGDVKGAMWRAGKKEAGRLLDGEEHNGFPEFKVAS